MEKQKEAENQTKCDGCGAYIDKINKVVLRTVVATTLHYYCGKCKMPYDEIHVAMTGARYFSNEKREVSREGELIGYTKKK